MMERKTVAPITVLCAPQELTIPEIGTYGERHGRELLADVEKYQLRIAGPWIFVSHDLPQNGKDSFLLEYCLPVEDGDRYAGGRFAIKSLERFPCAYSVYRGRLRHLFTKGYRPLVLDIIASGARFTGESREIYHSWVGRGSADNRIELQFGIA
jgi:hypothetical protein